LGEWGRLLFKEAGLINQNATLNIQKCGLDESSPYRITGGFDKSNPCKIKKVARLFFMR